MKARGKKKTKKTPHLGPFSTEFVLHIKNKNCNESSKCMQRRNLQTKKQKKNQTKQQ